MDREHCMMRAENGNCLTVGGFCTAVPDPVCEAVHDAYESGKMDAVRHGTWIQAEDDIEYYPFMCPYCFETQLRATKFCPECGARLFR